MAEILDQQQNTGSFVQQTPIFDVSQLYQVEVTSPEFKELLVRLYQQVNNVSIVLNNKESSYYIQEEFANSKLFFPTTGTNQLDLRGAFRKVLFTNNLPAGVTALNHAITIDANTSFVMIYGVANDTIGFNYYPLPFASAGGATNIELRATNTQVIITNNSGIVFNVVYVVLEYLKS